MLVCVSPLAGAMGSFMYFRGQKSVQMLYAHDWPNAELHIARALSG
jgi:hypothetical protein